MLSVIIITALLTATPLGVYIMLLHSQLAEARELLGKLRNRSMYSQNDQLETAKRVKDLLDV